MGLKSKRRATRGRCKEWVRLRGVALSHVRGKSGCAWMALRERDGKVAEFLRSKTCSVRCTFAIGAATKCEACRRRIFLQPCQRRQLLGVRCFDCFKVYCFRCLRPHFREKCRVERP